MAPATVYLDLRNGVPPTIGPEGVTPTFSTAAVNDGVAMIHGHINVREEVA